MKINIDKEDINRIIDKKIYFLDDYYYSKNEHSHLKGLNLFNTELYINNEKKKFEKYFIPEKEGIHSIIY